MNESVPAPALAPPPVALSRLVNDVAQETYKDLHATMDTLGDAELEVRRTKMLDYAMRTRHRIVRLMACVQWWGDYSAFHCSATEVRDASVARAADIELAADSLWETAHTVRGASATAPSLTSAAQLLGGESLFQCLPQLIENAAGLDVPLLPSLELKPWTEKDDLVLNLGTRTREFVRYAQPVGCSVLQWRASPRDAAVRIGVPGVWDVDVIADSLEQSEAVLRVLRVGIHVGSDEDAVGPLRRRSVKGARLKRLKSDRRSLCSPEEEERLRNMLEERMYWAGLDDGNLGSGPASEDDLIMDEKSNVDTKRALGKNPVMALDAAGFSVDGMKSGAEIDCCSKDECKHKLRVRRMLLALHNCMSHDVAAAFVMDHVRAQASALQAHPIWRNCSLAVDGTSKSADPWSPVVIKYWTNLMRPSSITVAPPAFEGGSSMVGVVHAEHAPAVLGVKFPQLRLSMVNIETLLIQSMELRAQDILSEIASFCEKNDLVKPLAHQLSDTRRSTLLLNLFPNGGIEVTIILPSGALRLHAYGSCAPCGEEHGVYEAVNFEKDRVFYTLRDMQKHIQEFVLGVKQSTVSLITARNGRAGDLAVIPRCPPGVASTGAKSQVRESMLLADSAPFVALQPSEANAFLSLRHVEVRSRKDSFRSAIFGPHLMEVACAGEQTSNPERDLAVSRRGLKRDSTDDGLSFFQGQVCGASFREPTGDPTALEYSGMWNGFSKVSAVAAADLISFWDEARVQRQRDLLLEGLMARGVIESVLDDGGESQPLSFLYRTDVTVNANPLPVLTAVLRLDRGEGWRLILTLLTDTWSDASDNMFSSTLSFDRRMQELTFKYPVANTNYMDMCTADIQGTKALVAIADELVNLDSKVFTIERRFLQQVRLRLEDFHVVVGWNSSSIAYTIGMTPSQSGTQQFAQLLEEAVNAELMRESYQGSGAVLGKLLEYASPLAVAVAHSVPANSSYCNVRYSMCWRARVTVAGKRGSQHLVDIDARQPQGVMIIDFARALAVKAESGGIGEQRSAAEHMIYQPVPKWDSVKKELISSQRGKVYHSGAGVMVCMSVLGTVLKALVESSHRGL